MKAAFASRALFSGPRSRRRAANGPHRGPHRHLADAAGRRRRAIAIPPKIDGTSLLPLLSGKTVAADWPERTLFIQCHRGLTPKLFQNSAAITQQYKLVCYPGTFNREDLVPSADQPVLEL